MLGLVALGERSGYDLALLAEDSVEHLWTPSRSQIYKTLPRLVARGLAGRREVEQKGRPDKSLYRVTAEGRKSLRAWLDDVEEEPASGRVVFPLKLFFCEFASPRTAQAQLAAYRSFLERRLERYETIRDAPRRLGSVFPQQVLAHGITRARATLAWIDEAAAAIATAVPASRSAGERSRRA